MMTEKTSFENYKVLYKEKIGHDFDGCFGNKLTFLTISLSQAYQMPDMLIGYKSLPIYKACTLKLGAQRNQQDFLAAGRGTVIEAQYTLEGFAAV